MRRISILFILLGLSSPFTSTSHAQSREIGAQSLALDDGNGHIVDITIPLMTGPGPYSWVLPITPGGSALSLPTPTTVGSMLYSNGTNAWLENTNMTATNLGVLSVAGAYQIGGNTVLSDAGTQNIFVGVGAGSANGAGAFNTALGYIASVGTGNSDATALGTNAQATAGNATALGVGATASGAQTTALGDNAIASAADATALGVSATASVGGTTALGWNATASALDATALGFEASANAANATALGNGASASTANEIQLGNTSVTLVNTSGAITSAGLITGTDFQATTALGATSPAPGGYYSDNAIVASGAVAFGSVVSQVGSYTMTHPGPGHYTLTFSSVNLTTGPDPLVVSTNTCCDGLNPVISEVNYSSLAPLIWDVYIYEWSPGSVTGSNPVTAVTLPSWVAADHDFEFILTGGGQ